MADLHDGTPAPQLQVSLEDPAASEIRQEPPPETCEAGPVDPPRLDDGDSSQTAPLSRNQARRLRRHQEWEDGREDRKARRRERKKRKALRRREDKAAQAQNADPLTPRPKKIRSKGRAPVALIVDCDYEDYMREPELVSLGNQIARCYSCNRRAEYRVHLYFSSFKGKMLDRFETVLKGTHRNWRNAVFTEDSFVSAAKLARATMREIPGGKMPDALRRSGTSVDQPGLGGVGEGVGEGICEGMGEGLQSVVYLTADSPNVLSHLEPGTSYVIGGLVDRNREKGLCLQRALEHGVRTARLPISQYMALATRHVLATSHVVEIMLSWLSSGVWGDAFMSVIPSRKGGQLKADPKAEAELAICEDEEAKDDLRYGSPGLEEYSSDALSDDAAVSFKNGDDLIDCLQ